MTRCSVNEDYATSMKRLHTLKTSGCWSSVWWPEGLQTTSRRLLRSTSRYGMSGTSLRESSSASIPLSTAFLVPYLHGLSTLLKMSLTPLDDFIVPSTISLA